METISFINATHNRRLRRRRIDFGISDGTDNGYANGYVAVPPAHPWHGKGHEDVDVRVHGGLTHAGLVGWGRLTDGAEYLWGATGVPSGWWVFGFDTNHCDDTMATWTRDRVIEETLKLQRQIELCEKIL